MAKRTNVTWNFPKIGEFYEERQEAHEVLFKGTGEGKEMTEWLKWPKNYLYSEEYKRLKETAKKIQNNNDFIIVVGIGGSYLTTRMLVESKYGSNYNEFIGTKIYFAGCDVSAKKLITTLTSKEDSADWSIIYISKSGGTIEPAIAFRFLWEQLKEKYGEEANERVYAITDASKGILKSLANEHNWESFVIPDGIGGRYSGLTAVGLLPTAVAGIDTDELLEGAIEAMEDCENPDGLAGEYAEWRYIQYQKGYSVEFLANMNPYMQYFGEWWKQLFGESEGKEGVGLFPASGVFPTDLHSLGQYLQQGLKGLICETFLSRKDQYKLQIPKSDLNDNLGVYEGVTFEQLNDACKTGSKKAHQTGGNPCAEICVGETEADMGYLMYSMFVACATSAYMLGVNPFDQPGVEQHKTETKRILSEFAKNKPTDNEEV